MEKKNKTRLARAAMTLLIALLTTFGAWAQETLTVCDGTGSNENVPFCGYNADSNQHNQMIYPAGNLTEMAGKNITQMVFYIDANASNGSYTAANRLGTWTVSLGETTETTLSGLNSTTTLTQVYQGYFDCSTGTLTLAFENDFIYNGGNLLVDLNHSAASWNRWYFLGVTAEGASYCYGAQRNFLPKTTFSYTTPPSCPKPTSLAVSNITNNSATINWLENGTATSWQICLNDNESNLITTNSKPYTLTGLTSLTAYTVKVRAVGSSEVSSWSNEVSFSTTAVAENVGDNWSDNFEGSTCGWELINGTCTNAWAWGSAVNNGGTHALYISNDGGTTNAYTNSSASMVYATKLLGFEDGKYEFSYDWLANGESSYDYLRVALVPASVTLTAGTSVPSSFGTTGLPTGWIALDGGSKLNLASEWQNKSATINVAAGNYYLVVAWRNDGNGGTNPPAAIDNVSITKVACSYEVTGLAVSDISTTGATLTWTAGEATQWQVAYSVNNSFEGATEDIVSAATYNMTGLVAGTPYYAKVRAFCGGSDYGSWSPVFMFNTACESLTVYPYTENFDSYTAGTGVLPDCWNRINTSSNSSYSSYPYIYSNSSYATSGSNSLRFSSYYSSYTNYDPQDQYAILPPMENLAGKQITLQAKGYDSNSTFIIGLMTNPTYVSTFTPIATQSLTNNFQEFTYYIPADATANYVAIMMEAATTNRTTNAVYIDDITISEKPSCPKPLSLEGIGNGQTALLTWTSDASEWQVAYSTDATANPNENIVGTSDTNSYEKNNLAIDTDHYFWVRTYCSATDQSDWVGPVSVHIGYCTPGPTSRDSKGITGVTFGIGDNVVNNSDANGLPNASPYYGDYSSMVGAIQAGVESTIAITTNTGSYPYTFVIWIDFDNSLSFEDNEIIYTGKCASGSGTHNATILVPATQTVGNYRMRIAGADSYFNSFYNNGEINWSANHSPCLTGSTYAVFHDYTLCVLETPSCLTPTGVNASDVTAHEATISWTSDADAWQIQLGENPAIDVTEATYTFTSLAAETAYSVKVRTNCGGTYSEWTNPVSFTTTVACPVPTVTVSNITATTAEVSCTNTEADHFNVMLGEELIGNNVAMPYTLTELEPSTSYTVKVQALCGGDDGNSEWSNGTAFTTAEVCPEGMVCIGTGTTTSNYLPAYSFYKYGYTQQIYTANEIGMDGQISSIEFKNTGAEKTMTCNIYMTATTKTDFVSTSDWVPLSDDNLVFSGEITFTVGEWTTIELDNPFDYDGTSNLLVTVANVSGTYSNSPHMACLTFPATNQALYSFRDQPGAYDITAPDVNGTRPSFKNRVRFAIGEPAACAKPKNLEVSEIGPRSAKLSWSPGAEEQSAWQICVNNDETNPITANINPFTLTGLTPETEYTVKVRANCGDDGYSEWSNAVTFTTSIACPAPTSVVASNITPTSATISWTGFADSYEMEYCIGDGFDFDDGTLQGWTNLIVNEEGGQWIHSNNNQGGYDYTSLAHGGTGFAMCYSFIDNVGAYDTDAYLISPQNYLITDGASLHFWYDMANDTYPENFEVCIATTDNPTTSDDFTSIWSLSNAKGNGGEKTNVRKRNTRYDNWREVTIDLSDYAGQSIWIAFHDVNEDMYEVWIDDITINSGQNWIPVEGTITDTQYTLTGLNPETSYMVRVRAIYDGEGESAWAVTSFKTLGEAMINFAAEGYATYYNSQKDVVLPDGMQAKIVTEGTSDGTLTYENIADGNIVHAGNAMLLQVSVATAANSPISIGLATPSAAAISGTNLLHGSDTRVDITTLDDYSADDYYYYMLSYDTSGANIGWYWDKDNTDGTGFWSGAHKAWLVLPKSLFQGSGAPFLGLPGWEDTTGIVPVGVNPEDGEWYTLQGLKIGKKPTTAGVYIHNGKKVLIP